MRNKLLLFTLLAFTAISTVGCTGGVTKSVMKNKVESSTENTTNNTTQDTVQDTTQKSTVEQKSEEVHKASNDEVMHLYFDNGTEVNLKYLIDSESAYELVDRLVECGFDKFSLSEYTASIGKPEDLLDSSEELKEKIEEKMQEKVPDGTDVHKDLFIWAEREKDGSNYSFSIINFARTKGRSITFHTFYSKEKPECSLSVTDKKLEINFKKGKNLLKELDLLSKGYEVEDTSYSSYYTKEFSGYKITVDFNKKTDELEEIKLYKNQSWY